MCCKPLPDSGLVSTPCLNVYFRQRLHICTNLGSIGAAHVASGLSAAYFEVHVVRQPHRCLITNIRQCILHSVDSGEAWGGSPKICFENRLPKIPVCCRGCLRSLCASEAADGAIPCYFHVI
jgi:hypothetical protein